MTDTVATLGLPRVEARRELKAALEKYRAGKLNAEGLVEAAPRLRIDNLALHHEPGTDHIPSNDALFYDHVLDTSVMLGSVPERYGWQVAAR